MNLIERIKGFFQRRKSLSYFDQKDEKVEYAGEAALFTRCGHTTPAQFKIVFWNILIEKDLSNKIRYENSILYRQNPCLHGQGMIDAECPKCFLEYLQKHAIRCALCGCAILSGEGVALYHTSSGGINKKAAAFVDGQAIGCLHADCCDSGGFFAGHWTENGFEPAFENGLTMIDEVMATGKSVLVVEGKQVK